jgi:hypothetical protein
MPGFLFVTNGCIRTLEPTHQLMEIDLSDTAARSAFIHATETGAHSNCPFCVGRMITSVSVGDRIVLLQGANAGRPATVTAERGFNDGEFLAHFDLEPDHYETRIGYSWDRFVFALIKYQTGYADCLSTISTP